MHSLTSWAGSLMFNISEIHVSWMPLAVHSCSMSWKLGDSFLNIKYSIFLNSGIEGGIWNAPLKAIPRDPYQSLGIPIHFMFKTSLFFPEIHRWTSGSIRPRPIFRVEPTSAVTAIAHASSLILVCFGIPSGIDRGSLGNPKWELHAACKRSLGNARIPGGLVGS